MIITQLIWGSSLECRVAKSGELKYSRVKKLQVNLNQVNIMQRLHDEKN